MVALLWIERLRRVFCQYQTAWSVRKSHAAATLTLERLEDRTLPSAGMLDPTFGAGGTVISNFPSAATYDLGQSVAIEQDGKVIVADTSGTASVVCYNSDGSIDTSFGSNGNGFVPFPGLAPWTMRAAVLPDGKILVAGSATSSGEGLIGFGVFRLNSDGSLDTTFGDNGTGEQIIQLQPAPAYHNLVGLAIQRVGTTDYSIVLAGAANHVSGPFNFAIVRLNSSGELDNSFNGDGYLLLPPGSYSAPVAVQGDKILIEDNGNSLARFNNDGSLDTSFGNGGVQTTANFPSTITVQPDGKIVVVGGEVFGDGIMDVERLNSDGTVDTAFGNDGQQVIDFNSDFVLGDPYADPFIMQLEQQGYTVVAQSAVEAYAYAVAIQPDGKILVAGDAGPVIIAQGFGYNDYPQTTVVRLNSDGSLDSTYGSGGKQIINYIGGLGDGFRDVVLQPDGNAVLTGYVLTGYVSPNGEGIYSVLTARYLAGAMSVTTQAAVTAQLDQMIAMANLSGQQDQVTFQASDQADVDTMIEAINGGLMPCTTPITVTIDLGGSSYSTNGVALNPPPNVNLVIQNGTLDPTYPALTVAGGQVSVLNCTLTTSGNTPTLLVTGGSVTLQNDTINQTAIAFTQPAIAVTGGTVNLGTATSPGNDTLSVNNSADLVTNTTPNPVSAVGDTFEVNGQATAWPIPLTVTIGSSIMLVGNSPPSLTGSVNGTPFSGATSFTTSFGDTVTVTLATAASSASPVGQYAITARLSGADAGNYVINPAAAGFGTMYVVSLGADPSSTTGAQAVTFWDNKGDARLITAADLSSLDVLNLVTQGGSDFDPRAVQQLQAWLSISPNATTSYQLAVQLAVMDLNALAGYVHTTDLVYAGSLLAYQTAYGITGLTSGGFIDVQDLMNAANAELALDPRATSGDPNQAYEAALALVLQSANGNTSFVQQELLWNLVNLYPSL